MSSDDGVGIDSIKRPRPLTIVDQAQQVADARPVPCKGDHADVPPAHGGGGDAGRSAHVAAGELSLMRFLENKNSVVWLVSYERLQVRVGVF